MLNSAWLLRMLEKSSPSPQGRLLALFDILGDWIEAPHLRSALADQSIADIATEDGALTAYLTGQARLAGLDAPEAIAQQLYTLALGALHAELRSPGCAALPEAGKAALTLLQSSVHAPRYRLQMLAAGVMFVLLLGAFNLDDDSVQPANRHTTATLPVTPALHAASRPAISPTQIAALNYSIERLRSGVCQYPQALMLPAEQRGPFLDSIVGGSVTPSSAEHAAALNTLVQKVDCYYAPIAMTMS